MQIKKLEGHNGGLTWWSLGQETDPAIADAIEKMGLPKYKPEPRSWLMALKAALGKEYPGHMVRPLKQREKNGYIVKREVKGEHDNNYPTVCSANISIDGEITVRDGEVDLPRLDALAKHYRHVLPASSVSEVLVQIATQEFGGITMREGGGVYFVPEQHVGKWMDVCSIAESFGPGNNLTVVPMEVNHMTLRDIRTSIVREVTSECERLQKEITENNFGDAALNNRIMRSQDTMERMEQYESLLGETLGACRDAIKQALTALSVARSEKDDNDFGDIYDEDAA